MRDQVLKIVEDEGVIWDVPSTSELVPTINQLVEEGVLVSGSTAGIKFMNEDYFFIKKGNPDNVYVVTKHYISFLVKGDLKWTHTK